MIETEQAGSKRACRALLAHIRATKHKTIPAWCAAHGLDRFKVQNAIRWKVQRVDVKFALEVERATDGVVPASWWTENTEGNEG